MISHCDLLHILSYDRLTGDFVWLITANNNGAKKGSKAGYFQKYDRRDESKVRVVIAYRRKLYMAHHLAWLYVTGKWPDGEIDHRDGDASNNAFDNLRLASRSDNCHNVKVRRDGKIGSKGVTLEKRTGKYIARAAINKIRYTIGRFNTLAEAADARDKFVREKHGAFYCNR